MLKLAKLISAQATAPSASELQARLDAAKASHAQLTADHAQAAYDSLTGEPDRVEALAIELAAAAKLIDTLSAAIGVARQREAEAARQRRIEGQKAQIERVTKILTRRQKYAVELSGAIAETVRLYRLLADNSERAGIAYPNGEGPAGAALSGKEIQRLVAHELFRQGGAGPLSQDPLPPFPGGTWPSIDLMGQPDRVTPLVKSIADANAHAVAVMRGEAPDVPADLVAADSVEEPEEPETAEAIPAGPLTDASAYTPVRVRMS